MSTLTRSREHLPDDEQISKLEPREYSSADELPSKLMVQEYPPDDEQISKLMAFPFFKRQSLRSNRVIELILPYSIWTLEHYCVLAKQYANHRRLPYGGYPMRRQLLDSLLVRELVRGTDILSGTAPSKLAAKVAAIAALSPYPSGEITKTVEGSMLRTQQYLNLCLQKPLARYLEEIKEKMRVFTKSSHKSSKTNNGKNRSFSDSIPSNPAFSHVSDDFSQVADGLVAALRAGKADEVAALSRRAREYLQGSDRERFIACLDAAVGRAELSPHERVEVYERLNCLVASVPALSQVADGLVAALRAGKADEVAALSRRAREYLQGSDRERFIACLDAAFGQAELSPHERVEVYERLNCLVASVPALSQVADGLVAALRAGKADEVAALSRRAREYLQGSDRERFIACLDAAFGRAELSPHERVEVYERLNCLVASVPALSQVADGLVAALRAGKADEVAALSRRAREYLQGSDRERFIACLDAAVGRAELSPHERVEVYERLNCLVASVPALSQVADGLVAALRAGKADEVAALSRRAREYLQGSDRERFIACLDAAVGRAELSPHERVEVYERLNCLVASVPALSQVADGLVAALRAGKADEVAALSRRAREYLQGSDRERFIACLDAAFGQAELSPHERVEVYERLNCLVGNLLLDE
jgi:hypothetical protein